MPKTPEQTLADNLAYLSLLRVHAPARPETDCPRRLATWHKRVAKLANHCYQRVEREIEAEERAVVVDAKEAAVIERWLSRLDLSTFGVRCSSNYGSKRK